VIKTDQKSLKSLLDQSLQTPEQQAWLHKFIGFDFQIEYKPGKENVADDALSRVMTLSWSEPQIAILEEIKMAIQSNAELMDIMKACTTNPQIQTHYAERNGLLYYKDKIVIPTPSALPHKLQQEYHSSPIGGHAGVTRTVAKLRAQFYWSTLQKDVQQFIQNYTICQQAKIATTRPTGLLQPLPIPTQVWEDIAMNFITGLPPSHGFTTIMVIVDRLTKYAHFLPMKI
jgi:hypothetical protein